MSEQKEGKPINQVAHSVADAMMIAQYNLCAPLLTELRKDGSEAVYQKDLIKIGLWRLITNGMCRDASLNVIYELWQHQRKLFNYFIFLRGQNLLPNDYHCVFLVKAKDDQWLAGSPANDAKGWLTQLIRAHSLTGALDQIKSQGHYPCPEANFIEKQVLFDYHHPIIAEDDGVIEMKVTEVVSRFQTESKVCFSSFHILHRCFFPA